MQEDKYLDFNIITVILITDMSTVQNWLGPGSLDSSARATRTLVWCAAMCSSPLPHPRSSTCSGLMKTKTGSGLSTSLCLTARFCEIIASLITVIVCLFVCIHSQATGLMWVEVKRTTQLSVSIDEIHDTVFTIKRVNNSMGSVEH